MNDHQSGTPHQQYPIQNVQPTESDGAKVLESEVRNAESEQKEPSKISNTSPRLKAELDLQNLDSPKTNKAKEEEEEDEDEVEHKPNPSVKTDRAEDENLTPGLPQPRRKSDEGEGWEEKPLQMATSSGRPVTDPTSNPAVRESVTEEKSTSRIPEERIPEENNTRGESPVKPDEELEQEVRYSITLQNVRRVWENLSSNEPDTVQWSVKILEQSVEELEAQLYILENETDEEESEFKLRCEAQHDLNEKLEEQIKWYNQEVLKMKDRHRKGLDYQYDADLETMNEFELAQLVKQLERERNNLYGDLRNKSWLLDNHSKEYYRFKELIKAYTGDLNHINRSLEQIWRQRSKTRESGMFGAAPVTTPGSLKWSSGESGIRPSYRIIDPKKGPVRKTAGVRSLPRLDQQGLSDYEDSSLSRKKRTRSMSQLRSRTKTVELKRGKDLRRNRRRGAPPRNVDETDRETMENSAATSVEPTSDPSEDMTVESFNSSVN